MKPKAEKPVRLLEVTVLSDCTPEGDPRLQGALCEPSARSLLSGATRAADWICWDWKATVVEEMGRHVSGSGRGQGVHVQAIAGHTSIYSISQENRKHPKLPST